VLRVDTQGVVAAVSGDLIQASDRLRVDAQDEAGCGCLASLEAGLATPFLLWAGGCAGGCLVGWALDKSGQANLSIEGNGCIS
jgi:hypothetical protein